MIQALLEPGIQQVMTISLLAIFGIGLIGASGSTLIALGFINAACITRTGFNRFDRYTRNLILLGALLGILFGVLRVIWCFYFPLLGPP
jgi:hypothetical protein